jgi:hypothetical protein
MYYEDLELCHYRSGPLDSDNRHVPLRAIGCLESGHPYNRGPIPIGVVCSTEFEMLDVMFWPFRDQTTEGLEPEDFAHRCIPTWPYVAPRTRLSLSPSSHSLAAATGVPSIECVDRRPRSSSFSIVSSVRHWPATARLRHHGHPSTRVDPKRAIGVLKSGRSKVQKRPLIFEAER